MLAAEDPTDGVATHQHEDEDQQSRPEQQPQEAAAAVPAASSPTSSKPGSLQRSKQMDHFHRIRENVKRAIAAKHTFMIHGRSRVVREALLARHWCEKLPRKSSPPGDQQQQPMQPMQHQQQQQLGVDSSPSALLAGVGDLSEPQNERQLVSRMLSNHTPDLLWNAGSDWSGWPAQDNKSTIFNRFSRASFTSKIGLCSNVRQMHWYYEAGIANTLFPRCYNISQAGDQLQAFVEDFRTTACLSLLKWLLERAEQCTSNLDGLASNSGLVPLRALDFAIGRVGDLVASRCHQDLDREPERVWSHQWEQFLGWYYKLVHQQASLLVAAAAAAGGTGSQTSLHKYLLAARHLMRKARPFWPQLDMDGCLNVWILKPGNKSRGRGIVLMNRLDDILAKLSPSNKTTDTRFVVQKYIERPLLIYDTKFDIRQWFVVTSAQPLTVWMYRESYLRFCSQKFSLRDFHESIHLSNNAVQCKYKNSPEREPDLPSDNMWDVASFKRFLAKRGDPDAWERLIYPGIKQGLVGSLLASQEAMDRRRNSFELYGADFMLMDDYSVWLIEINSHPDMSSSTSVTSRLCRKAMEDIIKVVVDHRENPGTADTGDFELIYKQKLSCNQAYLGTGLSLHGTRIQTASGSPASHDIRDKRSPSSAFLSQPSTRKPPTAISPLGSKAPASAGPALIDLIEELELQLDREFQEYVKLRQSGGLARQILPPVVVDHPVAAPPDVDRKPAADAQTNTASRTVDLGIVQSLGQHSAITDPPVEQQQSTVADTRRSPRFNSGQRSSASQGKRVHRTNLISKIIDLHKHSGNPRSTTTSAFPYGKPPTTNYANVQPDRGNTAAANNVDNKDKTQQDKANRLNANKPAAGSSIASSSKHKLSSGKSRAKDKKANATRCIASNRIASSQVLLDVTDMYAIGLAVNK